MQFLSHQTSFWNVLPPENARAKCEELSEGDPNEQPRNYYKSIYYGRKPVRGQGYDGASNMRGEFNGLKALILKDNPSAHYIHCFAHQLQLVIVAVAKKHAGVKTFYEFLSMVVTTVSASCKGKDMLREEKKARAEKEILEGEIKTGKGLNEEVSLARTGDTQWGSHHRTIISLLRLFPEVVTVLQYVKEDGDCSQQWTNAKGILSYFKKTRVCFLYAFDGRYIKLHKCSFKTPSTKR
ncbi:putative ribonuclease H-like superfamily [Helianthus debilis subsp. tardiflorus]